MYDAKTNYRHVSLTSPEDPEYIAFIRRIIERRPSRGGPRAAGEYLGGLVERAVRHWLSGYVPLQEERILTWEQRLPNGRQGRLYRELDAIWRIDHESLCLFEMKLTFPENMEQGVGLSQLEKSADVLSADKQYRYLLMRLVYVAEEPVTVLEGLPTLEPNDEYEEIGVIWVPPSAVEQAAQALEIELPENWLAPESREGHWEDPEREEWRQYADSDAEPAEDADNPLAEALRRAMEQKG